MSRRFVLTLFPLFLLAGCTSIAIGRPEPALTALPAIGTTTQGQPALAPKVPKELDATRLVNAPCDALTGSELSGLDPGLATATGTNASTPLAAACGWASPDLSQAIDISFATFATNGLDKIYSERGDMAYWQPMVIMGYPAVAASESDNRSDGTCVVSAGVNDHLFFFAEFITFTTAQQPRSCALAAKAAGYVIDNLQGGG